MLARRSIVSKAGVQRGFFFRVSICIPKKGRWRRFLRGLSINVYRDVANDGEVSIRSVPSTKTLNNEDLITSSSDYLDMGLISPSELIERVRNSGDGKFSTLKF